MTKSFLIAALAYTLIVLVGNPIEQNHPLEDPLTTKVASSASLKSEAALKAPALPSITASSNIPATPVVTPAPAPVTYIAPVASSTVPVTFTSAAQA